MIRPNRSFTVACARKKFESMAPFAPDLIITNCPGCGLVLDREQWAVNELTGADFQIPVLNYAELAGLLLGWDPYDVVGIQGHTVPVEPLLDRIGIPQSLRPAYLRDGVGDTDATTATASSGLRRDRNEGTAPMTSPVLILGGGVTGMHVATTLAELGHRSILLEKTSEARRAGAPAVAYLPVFQSRRIQRWRRVHPPDRA